MASGGLKEKGSGRLAKDLGSGFRSILLICLEIEQADLILIDEPETFLHSSLQVAFARYVLNAAKNGKQFVVSSHSESILNSLQGTPDCKVFRVWHQADMSQIQEIKATRDISILIDSLGLKASTLLQANGIIWVEGPSDRLYVNAWISRWSKDTLVEGRDYQCLIYGGRLLAHFEATSPADSIANRIAMLSVNRNAIIVVDSDRRSEAEVLSATKRRVLKEIDDLGGLGWVTHGRTIENYLPTEVVQRFFGPKVADFGRYDSIDQLLLSRDSALGARIDKMTIARHVASNSSRESIALNEELAGTIQLVCQQIRRWNATI